MNILSFIFVLLVVLPVWGDWFSTQSPDTCTGPRCRKSWSSLSAAEKKNYMNLIFKMKKTIITARPGSTRSLYNLFVDMHLNSMNSAVWHGTSHFLMVHRWFIYQFESALRYVCRVNGSSLNPPITNCCNIALPYWNSEVDYENSTTDSYVPQDHSAVFDTNYMGPAPVRNATNYTVNGVAINPTSWPTVTQLSNNPSPSQFTRGNLTYTLKRWMNSTAAPFTIGPVWIINKMNSSANYGTYAAAVEAGPHSGPHIWLSFQMQTMSSPDDPLFMLHHSNVERLLTMWQDCWDYELVPAANITTKQYQALNPISTGPPKVNPYNTSQPFDVGIDTPMQYWWKSYTSGGVQVNQDNVIFPQSEWPTPRNMHFIGNATKKGWGGMYYVYGPDNIVSLIQKLSNSTSSFCPLNTKWRLVNVNCSSSLKRYISDKDKDDKDNDNRSGNDKSSQGNIKSKWDEFKKKGKNDKDAWEQLVDWECQSTPKIEITDHFEAWISMTGLAPELWDRSCDCVSDKWKKKHGGKDKGK